MHRSALAAAVALLLGAIPMAAQSGVRLVLAPQVGGVVAHSRGAEADAFGSVVAEVQAGSWWSVSAEMTSSLSRDAIRACPALEEIPCRIGTDLRTAAAAGVVVRPVRLGPLEPYAGVSAGLARWRRVEQEGDAPLAAVRAGLDLRVVGPIGIRADLVRRIAWTDTPGGSPLHADVLSLGAWFAVRR